MLLIFLKAYEKLLSHIKNTPSQQWKWQYFDEARKEAVQKTPFVEFLTCGSFQNLHVTYTITPEEDATTLKTRLEDIFKKFCESKGITSPEVGVNEMERHLKVASGAMEAKPAMKLEKKKNLYKCLDCEQPVPEEGDESNCTEDCNNQCPPGVWLSGHASRNQFRRRVRRTTESLGNRTYVKHLRVSEDEGSDA